ncbi:tol-pal system protein YbgF [Candidatus Nitrosacidococcus sp. I8]|uniref:tol-pal system protein YbgF n=1 Tax=Candidatus Nitrosacidococcus sp. I8 TaxID=2942908 RepID=UPI002227710C|nr:tol-pal system protein YbgF [Candidatus Nitrosacidococcus sp. I8]CAH9019762.1 Cell division coordinator CpoB [Candidatus Nitrosacidococcus sp. I8]
MNPSYFIKNIWFIIGGICLFQLPIVVSGIEVIEAGANANLAQRVQHLENIIQGQGLSKLLTQLNQLESEVRQLQGENENLQYEIENLKNKQRELYVDLDRRIESLNTLEGNQSLDESTEENNFKNSNFTSDSDLSDQAYQHALGVLQEGHYTEAITAFTKFSKQYPESNKSADAQYWLGEAYYMNQNFQESISTFQTFINDNLESLKVPNAILKQGISYYELSQKNQAKDKFEKIISEYPNSTARQLADEYLKKVQ